MPVIGEVYDGVVQWIGQNHKTLAVAVGGIVVTWKIVSVILANSEECKRKKAWKQFESAPKDTVIFHTLPRGLTIPNLSPFGMKLETYFRAAKITYELDFENLYGPLGKTPWITLNGEHIGDSELIIKLLTSKYNVKIGDYSEEQRAIAKAVRIMMDEYLYWGLVLWRYVHSERKGLDQIFDMPPFALKVFYKFVNGIITERAWNQGLGRHSKEQVIELMNETLKTASLLLGDKPFLLGDEPCEEDFTLFGMLGMVMWAAPGSPYETYMKEELPNLTDYCNRMKTRYWSDWDQCLAKKSEALSS